MCRIQLLILFNLTDHSTSSHLGESFDGSVVGYIYISQLSMSEQTESSFSNKITRILEPRFHYES